MESGKIAFGLITTYLSRPILLHLPSPGLDGTDRHAVDNEFNSTFIFEYGLTDKLELGIMIPLTFCQDGDGNSAISAATTARITAMRDLRFGPAYSFLTPPAEAPTAHAAGGFGLAVRLEMSAPTGDTEQFASEKSAVWTPSIALDYRWHRLFFAAEPARACARRRTSRVRASAHKLVVRAAPATTCSSDRSVERRGRARFFRSSPSKRR